MRLFIAVWPPPGVLSAIESLERPAIAGVRWTSGDQWHVTLRFLGDVATAEPVTDALRAAALPQPFTAEVGPATSTFRGQILHLPVSKLGRLASVVTEATAGLGKPPEQRPFRGHLTLARGRRGASVDLRSVAGQPVRGEWPVDEVTVVESRLSKDGSTYTVVDRVALPR